MFITKDSAEELLPVGLADPGVHVWWTVFLPHAVPWFLVTYMQHDSKGEMDGQIVLLSDNSHLIELSEVSELCIKTVELVSPGHMNGTRRWMMDPLEEIWRVNADETEDTEEIFIYVLNDGREYVRSNYDDSKMLLKQRTRIFKC